VHTLGARRRVVLRSAVGAGAGRLAARLPARRLLALLFGLERFVVDGLFLVLLGRRPVAMLAHQDLQVLQLQLALVIGRRRRRFLTERLLFVLPLKLLLVFVLAVKLASADAAVARRVVSRHGSAAAGGRGPVHRLGAVLSVLLTV